METTSTSGCLTIEGTTPERLATAVWRQLQACYEQVPPRSQDTGSVLSEVRLQCGVLQSVSAVDALAVAITDLQAGVTAEIGVAPAGQSSTALFWRVLAAGAGVPPWDAGASEFPGVVASTLAAEGARWERRRVKLQPTFAAMAAEMLAHSGARVLLSDHEVLETARSEVEYWKQLGTGQAQAARAARVELEELRRQMLGAAHAERRAPAVREAPRSERTWRLRDLAEWAAANSERIIVHQRAIGASRRSLYEDEKLAYEALEFLAGDYSAMRRGEATLDAVQDKLRNLGLELTRSIEQSRSGEEGEQYFIRWGGQRRFLRWHLRKGVSRDPRYALRIYFCWVEEVQRVLVGSLPAHLDNRIT